MRGGFMMIEIGRKGHFFTKGRAQDGVGGACGALLPGEPKPPQTPSPPHKTCPIDTFKNTIYFN
jgi:hypothetical protein